MDEMEVLCSRIAIMSGGCIVALGSALDLRLAHSSGYVVVFKLHREEITTDAAASVKSRRDVLKEEMSRKFKCVLKEDHEIQLHYDLDKDIKYSDLFRSLEQLKQAYPDLIEDYWVSETTLEEVFLSLAKTHHTDTNTPVTAS
ncbi:hypothetical protein K1T71_010168 [Dendrolimus kikuchii]|uniref:Uncharacterized protein n=1 Tax=Dendrolimus kikuchii TaxID=765133 RepID=A0ACC1CRW9_9NEOP|nr:hypothetical protein K1T71_010168 [Dendrolimus kikuchii]